MPLVVGVTFRRVGKVYYFDPGDIDLHEGDFIIAETARGVEFGEVALEPRNVPEEELVAPLKKIVRIATGVDLEREAANRDREKHAYDVCNRKIIEHDLPMKLLEAEYAFDGSQVTFSFSAEGRVDFRELVKDVASALKIKVQLHQIGVRDEAKLVGGYGGCGRPLCCATFLNNFEPISMKMAKDQSLFLNPAKFSGVCGKLMCCLRYEHEHYKYAQKRLPAVGAIVQLEKCKAKVVDVNVISNTLTVQTEEEVLLHIPASQANLDGICRKHGIACNMADKGCQPLLPDGEIDDADLQAADIEDVEPDVETAVELEPVDVAEIIPEVEIMPEPTTGVTWRTPVSHVEEQVATVSDEAVDTDCSEEAETDASPQEKKRNKNRNGKMNGGPHRRYSKNRSKQRPNGNGGNGNGGSQPKKSDGE